MFVIVEADTTHAGVPKPLLIKAHRERILRLMRELGLGTTIKSNPKSGKHSQVHYHVARQSQRRVEGALASDRDDAAALLEREEWQFRRGPAPVE